MSLLLLAAFNLQELTSLQPMKALVAPALPTLIGLVILAMGIKAL
jgi:hypothetical protein